MKMSEFVSGFVKSWQSHINKVELKKDGLSSDLLINLEGRITAREINVLNRTHLTSNADVNEASLKPYIEFLAKRRERILNTEADYSYSYTDTNLVCEKLAHAITRKLLGKQNVSEAEVAKYLTCGATSSNTYTYEDRQKILRQRVAACIRELFSGSEDLADFMAKNIQKSEWQDFIKCCDVPSLKDFFLTPAYIKQQGNIYNAVTAKADDKTFYTADNDMNDAKLFCLLEISKRQRDVDPTYLGMLGSLTGIRGGRRVSQLQRLQDFIVSDNTDLDQYMKQFKSDEKSMGSGHTKILVGCTKKMRANRNENSDSPRQVAGI